MAHASSQVHRQEMSELIGVPRSLQRPAQVAPSGTHGMITGLHHR